MQFTRLRLHGFKSFVDPTELLIEPGLTGIVGPNGCGKSNLVEALQWVMGESSARRLRGGDMDDVIFGGTEARHGRGFASVTLTLDNSDRSTSQEIADADELEVDRRIDRGKGSSFRVNGKDVRARDVQLLFADAAAGAQSVSMIGQGRIGWLINAKPAERRQLLEEAAGIGGLQQRRREAELKLGAAEANLTRLRDVEITLTQQIERLRKQARQAERYRHLSEQLRLGEALLAYRQFLDQGRRLIQAEERLRDAAARVAEASVLVETAERARTDAQAALPPLREREVSASREVERLAAALLGLDAEAERVAGAIEEARRRLVQLDQDSARENGLTGDAESALARLGAEAATIRAEQAREATALGGAEAALASSRTELAECESALAAATALAASGEAARLAVAKRLAGLEDRRRSLMQRNAEAEARAREIALLTVPAERLAESDTDARRSESDAEAAQSALEAADRLLRDADQARQEARAPAQEAELAAVRLRAEIEALQAILRSAPCTGFAPLLDGIVVSDGLEAALGAALGDDLFAATVPAAPIYWTALPPIETAALPKGARPLADFVRAPDLLRRRLGMIGLVADEATGGRLQKLLAPGQILVSRNGAMWRWDGFTIAARAETAAATRLAQRARLNRLEAERMAAEEALSLVHAAEREAAVGFASAQENARAARIARAEAAQHAVQCRQAYQALSQQQGQADARRLAAAELDERLGVERTELALQEAEILRERDALPDAGAARQDVERLRGEQGRLREGEAAARGQLDLLVREAEIRGKRLDSIEAESGAWRDRLAAAATQRLVLAERRQALDAERAALVSRPAALTGERAGIALNLEEHRQVHKAAEVSLVAAEGKAAEAESSHAAQGRVLAQMREDQVRAEAAREQVESVRLEAAERIAERFQCRPAELPDAMGLGPESLDEPTDAVASRVERLGRDREAIGPVNLMAEREFTEMTAEFETIRAESTDLTEAIARLRQAVRELDREGRARLTAAFDAVNRHFQTLFTQLFGGGEATLILVGGDGDPLEAGLEIMASPPGKKLQSLSLLSGGERALTALALVFAVFLTNPAPVCVLDEVDAPLDDANVGRFCTLVGEIAQRAATRFLIVTHHRVTMARMDRLYGVTMVERGVSRLVSVELGAAERLRRTA